jgi:hypothetical protein
VEVMTVKLASVISTLAFAKAYQQSFTLTAFEFFKRKVTCPKQLVAILRIGMLVFSTRLPNTLIILCI